MAVWWKQGITVRSPDDNSWLLFSDAINQCFCSFLVNTRLMTGICPLLRVLSLTLQDAQFSCSLPNKVSSSFQRRFFFSLVLHDEKKELPFDFRENSSWLLLSDSIIFKYFKYWSVIWLLSMRSFANINSLRSHFNRGGELNSCFHAQVLL